MSLEVFPYLVFPTESNKEGKEDRERHQEGRRMEEEGEEEGEEEAKEEREEEREKGEKEEEGQAELSNGQKRGEEPSFFLNINIKPSAVFLKRTGKDG